MKAQRREAIVRLLRTEQLGSQDEIVGRLAALGFTASQATVSRDLEDLGLVRIRDGEGRLRYAPPDQASAPRGDGVLRATLREFLLDVQSSGSLVVLKTPPGAAGAVAEAIDRNPPGDIIGTVAGDNTILVIARERARGSAVAKRFRTMSGLR